MEASGGVCREIVNLGGVLLAIDPAVMSARIIEMIRNGVYERAEARKLRAIIRDGDVVLEIGAGIGFLTTLMAVDRRVARIVAYEANRSLMPVIEGTLSLNRRADAGKVELHNAVLSNDTSRPEVEFHVDEEFWMSSCRPTRAPLRVDHVPVHSFDDVLRTLQPSLIVCDIEGGEQHLFPNAALGSVRTILLELHHYVIGGAGMVDVFSALHEQGLCYDQYLSEQAVVVFSRFDR